MHGIWRPLSSLYVTIIANDPESTLDLSKYLDRSGIASHTTRALRDLSMIPPAANAVVILPDDFRPDDVDASISSMRVLRPRLLIIIVTSNPRRFHAALDIDGRSLAPVVLPKPTFAWTIVDILRAHYPSVAS